MDIAEAKILSKKHPIIVYDGRCILCNGFVQWIIKNDVEEKFRFTTLQDSETIRDSIKGDTVVLIVNRTIYTHSDVALEALPLVNRTWKMIRLLKIFPKFLRDSIYRFIARNRYRWFGKSKSCILPNQAQKHLFLD